MFLVRVIKLTHSWSQVQGLWVMTHSHLEHITASTNNNWFQTVTEDKWNAVTQHHEGKAALYGQPVLDKRPMGGALEDDSGAILLCLGDELRFFHSRCQRAKLMDQMTAEGDTDITGLRAGIPLSTAWVFFQFTSVKLSLTLMSGPPGDISGGQQVQSQGSPAAVVYLLTSHCWSNKPKQCGKLHSDIRSLIFIWYPNHTALSALCYTWL